MTPLPSDHPVTNHQPPVTNNQSPATSHQPPAATGTNFRFTVLTSRLLRLEFGARFEDRASQTFWYREQAMPDFAVTQTDELVEIVTEHLHLVSRPENPHNLTITLRQTNTTWQYGDPDTGNLLGTTRTLDTISGQTQLEPGLLSRNGWVVFDDSRQLVFDEQGWLQPRPAGDNIDLYFFGYGLDFKACLRDFVKISGRVPLIPRYALGNWWSRYWAYTQDELSQLMRDFRQNDIPLSVCIIDMDWHITETGNDSSGWTGYTWNKELFPDPAGFIQFLHDQNLHTALNLHPAAGLHPHEQAYPAMAEALGLDPASQKPIPFDIANPTFATAYFRLLHHPHEAMGIDFWWTDWQQGEVSGLPGLDPLWWLNHLHYHDLGRDGVKRPFVFSRWGGLGNHRYPIGFSGDTIVNWSSLAFQPYFTATAANVNYGWWSHDIGGHMFGIEEAELYARWVQFGVFSPIFRLHATKSDYHERRPWGYDAETFRVTREAMQLRHALIPYLYTMNWLNHSEGLPFIRPLYHDYPQAEPAYHCPDQYTFGDDLIAAPFTAPQDPHTRLSRQVLWLPEGDWFDFFSGQPYPGGTWQALYGTLAEIPVLARAGAIVPLAPRVGWGGVANPTALELVIFPGRDNHFTLYEDDNDTTGYQNGQYALTPFTQRWLDGTLRFRIGAVQGQAQLVPATRTYTLTFRAVTRPGTITVRINNVPQQLTPHYHDQTLTIGPLTLTPTDTLVVELGEVAIVREDTRPGTLNKLLDHFRLETMTKQAIHDRLPALIADPTLLTKYIVPLADSQLRALLEIITGAGVTHIDHAGPEEKVILWNNGGDEQMTYALSGFTELYWDTELRYHPAGGTVPNFEVVLPGQFPAGSQWQLQFNYSTIFSQTVTTQPKTSGNT